MAWKCKWCGEEVYEFIKGNRIDKNKVCKEENATELHDMKIYYCPNCEDFSNFRIEDIAEWEDR